MTPDDAWKALTFLVAAVAAYIAWSQRRIAADKLRLDLFERRSRVFDAVRSIISDAYGASAPDSQKLLNFAWDTTEGTYLFGPEVKVLLDETFRGLSELAAAERKLSAPFQNPADREKAEADYQRLSAWLPEHRKRFDAAMLPYLDFRDVRRASRFSDRPGAG